MCSRIPSARFSPACSERATAAPTSPFLSYPTRSAASASSSRSATTTSAPATISASSLGDFDQAFAERQAFENFGQRPCDHVVEDPVGRVPQPDPDYGRALVPGADEIDEVLVLADDDRAEAD